MLAVRMVFSINRLRKSLCVTWNGKEGRSRKTKNTGEKNLRFRERATVRVGLSRTDFYIAILSPHIMVHHRGQIDPTAMK